METTKSFTCCGGSDENTPEHTQDCPDFGNPKWLTKLHESEMKFVGEQLTSSKARIASLEAQLEEMSLALGRDRADDLGALNLFKKHILSLSAQLEKAEKVIGYYAEENTWISKNLDKEGSLVSWSKKTPNDISIFPYSIGSSNGNFNCLGRRAREYFAEKEKNPWTSVTDARAWNELGLQNKIDRLASQVNSLTVTNRELRNRLKAKDEQFDRLHQMYQQEKQNVKKAEAAHG